jgi:hypothetical protein
MINFFSPRHRVNGKPQVPTGIRVTHRHEKRHAGMTKPRR